MRWVVAVFTPVKIGYLVLYFVCLAITLVFLFLMTKINIFLFITIFPFFILASGVFVYYLYVTLFKYLYYHRKKQYWKSPSDFALKVSRYRLRWIALLSIVIILAYVSLPGQITVLLLNIILVWQIFESISDIYATYREDIITEFYTHDGIISARCIEKYPYLGLNFFREWFWPPNTNNEFEIAMCAFTKGYRKHLIRYQKAESLTREELEQKKTTQRGKTKEYFVLFS